MLLQVHDELVFEAPEAGSRCGDRGCQADHGEGAEPAVSISVPLVVDARAAANWDDAH
jgi:DNA polymerase-1